MNFSYFVPTKVICGEGCLEQLPQELPQLGLAGKKCLVVSGQRFARMTGLLDRLTVLLEKAHVSCEVFARVEPNPMPQTVQEGVQLARSFKARWLLALGGGSAIDAAKAIALQAVNQGELQQFAQGMRPETTPLPTLAIPTTAGTGSEVTPYSIITNSKDQDKFAINLPELFPRLAFLDPQLTLSCPEQLTTDAALDALCHAVEAYFSKRRSPLTDLLSNYAMGLILRNIFTVREQPHNLQVRGQLLLASSVAGMAIANSGTLLPHALGYPLTIRYNLAHGRATALLEFGFLKKMEQVDPERARQVGALLGSPESPARAWRDLLERLGVAPQLQAWGVKPEEEEPAVALAMHKRHRQLSPGELQQNDLAEIFRWSL
jgi:alcohol dehydrogenase class IV